MRIGFINNFGNYPPQGGSSVHVYQIIKGLTERGHTICGLWGHYPYPLFKRYFRRSLIKFIQDIDVLYIRLGGGLSQDIYSLLKLFRASSLPLIWEINAPAYERRGWRTDLIEKMWRLMGRLVDASICVSREMQSYVHSLGINHSYVIPNGSDPELFHPSKRRQGIYGGFKDDDFWVLWAGRSEFPWQGLDIIFKVAERMESLNKKIKFVLITDAENIKYELKKNVFIIEPLPYLSIPDYIASADLCLCLYHNCEWSKIGFYGSSLKLFDYMSCARPIIATDTGQIGRIIKNGENGILTDNSIQDIVDKIQLIFNNRELGNRLGLKAREEIVNYYNWDRAVNQTIEILNKTFEEKRKCLTG